MQNVMGQATSPFGRAVAFYVIAIGLALLIAVFGQRLGNGAALLSMFTPLASVLIMKLLVARDGYRFSAWRELGVHRPGVRFWPLAIILPALVLLPGYGMMWASDAAQVAVAPWDGIFKTVVKIIIGILIVSALGGLGEEIGWRGYLQPHLMQLGRIPALLTTGFLHGAWHLPLLLLTPVYHQDGTRWIVVPLFMVALTLAGPIYGWFRIASGSIWPAAILHAALNRWWEVFDVSTITGSKALMEYVAGESGAAAIAMYAITAVLLWRVAALRSWAGAGAVKAA